MKARYRTLDAMRGVAALTVVAFHTTYLLGDCCIASRTKPITFGYLAVDLFFVLSGFVIAHNYDPKFNLGYTTRRFMAVRFGRLLPVYMVGLLLGLAIPMWRALHGLGGGKQAITSFLFNDLMLPAYHGLDPKVPFPLDPPAWSLFFELWVANVAFAVAHKVLQGKALAILIVLSLAALLIAQHQYGAIDVGAYWRSLPGGVPRVLFSFFVGVALSRFRKLESIPTVPAWVILALLEGSFWLPFKGLSARIYEVAAVAFLYPALVLLGSQALERRPRLGSFLGDASYAIYAIHIPLAYLTNTMLSLAGVQASPPVYAAYLGVVLIVATLVSAADQHVQVRIKRLLAQPIAVSPQRGG